MRCISSSARNKFVLIKYSLFFYLWGKYLINLWKITAELIKNIPNSVFGILMIKRSLDYSHNPSKNYLIILILTEYLTVFGWELGNLSINAIPSLRRVRCRTSLLSTRWLWHSDARDFFVIWLVIKTWNGIKYR